MNLKRKKKWLTFWFLLIGFLLCWGPVEAKEKVLIVGDVVFLQTMDTALSGMPADISLVRNVYQSLVRYKFNTSEIEPDLAKSWTVSEDGTVYTFKLRDDVKWHKGFGNFTAQDVKYTFDRAMDPKTKSLGRADLIIDIKEVKVLDDHTVQFILKAPYRPFLYKLAGVKYVGIMNQKAIEKFGKDYNRNAVGTGPFILESWDRNGAVLIANKEFHEGAPGIDKVVYKAIPDNETMMMALLNGEIDLVWVMPRDKAVIDRLKSAGIKITVTKRPNWQVLWMNNKAKPFDNVLVRRAIAHAIDKDALVKYVFEGFAQRMDSPIPPGFFGHADKGFPKYEYNPAKAKALLAQAGYPNGLEVSIDTFQNANYLPLATALEGQFRQVGINLKVNVTDMSTWMGKVFRGKSIFTIMSQKAAPDPDLFLVRYYHSDSIGIANVCKYDKIDDLIEKARHEKNVQKRKDDYLQIQKKFMEDIPAISLLLFWHPHPHKKTITNIPEWDVMWGFDFYRMKMAD